MARELRADGVDFQSRNRVNGAPWPSELVYGEVLDVIKMDLSRKLNGHTQ